MVRKHGRVALSCEARRYGGVAAEASERSSIECECHGTEQGDGEARGALLEKMYGADLMAALRAFRAIWDPRRRMNLGKVLDPYPITANLRVVSSYKPPDVRRLFDYPEDGGSFTKATLRCVGVGQCRRREIDGRVMCPCHLGTNEEKHSTRGRARLLLEMTRGDALTGGFKSETVEEAPEPDSIQGRTQVFDADRPVRYVHSSCLVKRTGTARPA